MIEYLAILVVVVAGLYFLNWYGNKKLIESGKRKLCPNCREIIDGLAKVCKHCGRDV